MLKKAPRSEGVLAFHKLTEVFTFLVTLIFAISLSLPEAYLFLRTLPDMLFD